MATNTVKFFQRTAVKGASRVFLALSCFVFALYAERHFPLWGFVLAFLLAVGASVPMILFFNLFMSPDSLPKSYQIDLFEGKADCDLFPHHRDDPFDD
jgi:hypothetical protein